MRKQKFVSKVANLIDVCISQCNLKILKNRRHSWRGHIIKHNEFVLSILEGAIPGNMPLEDLNYNSYCKSLETQQLTVIRQWREWIATIADGKLPANPKTEGEEEEEEEEEEEGGGGGGEEEEGEREEEGGGGGEETIVRAAFPLLNIGDKRLLRHPVHISNVSKAYS